MCSLTPSTHPWISTDNPSADKAAIVTVLTNPAPLGIQTFYKMYIYNVYIYIYSYIHISNIFVAVYALNAGGSVRSIWGLYAAVQSLKTKPRICFSKEPHPRHKKVYHSFPLQIILFSLRSPYSKKKHFGVLLTTHISAFSFSSVLTRAIYVRVFIIYVKQLLLESNACISEWFFFICFLAARPTFMSCLFFLLSEGGHDVVTI